MSCQNTKSKNWSYKAWPTSSQLENYRVPHGRIAEKGMSHFVAKGNRRGDRYRSLWFSPEYFDSQNRYYQLSNDSCQHICCFVYAANATQYVCYILKLKNIHMVMHI